MYWDRDLKEDIIRRAASELLACTSHGDCPSDMASASNQPRTVELELPASPFASRHYAADRVLRAE